MGATTAVAAQGQTQSVEKHVQIVVQIQACCGGLLLLLLHKPGGNDKDVVGAHVWARSSGAGMAHAGDIGIIGMAAHVDVTVSASLATVVVAMAGMWMAG